MCVLRCSTLLHNHNVLAIFYYEGIVLKDRAMCYKVMTVNVHDTPVLWQAWLLNSIVKLEPIATFSECLLGQALAHTWSICHLHNDHAGIMLT